MKEVDADLYEFLQSHETGIGSIQNEIKAWVHVPFDDLQKFVNIVGYTYFVCGGVECRLQEDNVCVDINYFIEGAGHLLSSYKNCFNENDWDECEKEILMMESED